MKSLFHQQNLKTLVAVELNSDSVSFAQMNPNLNLEAWNTLPLFDVPFQRVDYALFLEKVYSTIILRFFFSFVMDLSLIVKVFISI